MNLLFIIGNLTKEPEKVDGVSSTLCKLNVAVNENFTKEDGTRPVQYFNVTVWNKLGDNCLKYLKKGSKVGILGKIQNRSWEDKDGNKRYAQEIVASEIEFLSSPGEKPKEKEMEQIYIPDTELPF